MGNVNSISLKEAKNIGSTILIRLNEIGVYSLADLAHLSPAKAYQKICEQNPGKSFPICYYLYSLQGALLDVHWDDLPSDLKLELRTKIGR